MNTAYDFSVEFGVTKAYQQAKHLPLPQRELACLRAMYPPYSSPSILTISSPVIPVSLSIKSKVTEGARRPVKNVGTSI